VDKRALSESNKFDEARPTGDSVLVVIRITAFVLQVQQARIISNFGPNWPEVDSKVILEVPALR